MPASSKALPPVRSGNERRIPKLIQFKKTGLFVAVITALSGCATNKQTGKIEVAPSIQQGFASIKGKVADIYDNPDPCSNNSRNIGITLGMLAGAFIGHQMQNDNTGTLVGAAVGAGVGGLIGHNVDARRCELSKIAAANNLTLASATITQDKLAGKGDSTIGLDVMVKNDGDEFVPGTNTLTPKGRKAYGEIADRYTPDAIANGVDANAKASALAAAQNRKVLIVGHSDEGGDPAQAAELSEARAKAVALVFSEHHVSPANIYYQGAGNSLPVANNSTEKGSSENRRVQIVDVPTDADLKQYLSLRAPDPRNFAGGEMPSVIAQNDAPVVPAHAHKSAKQAHHSHRSAHQVGLAAPDEPKSAPEESRSVQASVSAFDFGGRPDLGKDTISLGAPIHTSMFNLISTANATEPVIMDSCRKDRPHVSTDVHNLATGAKLAAMDNSNFITGLYGAPIAGVMNGNSIFILHPYATKDAGIPTPEPTFQIYRKDENGNANKPLFSKAVPVNVYRGSNATLYRMFVGGAVGCMDMVVRSDDVENGGRLYYQRDGQAYVAQGKFVASK